MKHVRTIVVVREEFPPGFDMEVTQDKLDVHAEVVADALRDRFSGAFPFSVDAVTTLEED